MGSALVVATVKYGLLALLWFFVLLAVRAVRQDLWGGGRGGGAVTAPAVPGRRPKRRGQPRTLVVTEGALRGTTLSLGESPILLGRGNDCTLVLDDDYASTHHARLAPGADGWCVEDLGSTNGTYLGSSKVSRSTPVPTGTPIRVGQTTLELRP